MAPLKVPQYEQQVQINTPQIETPVIRPRSSSVLEAQTNDLNAKNRVAKVVGDFGEVLAKHVVKMKKEKDDAAVADLNTNFTLNFQNTLLNDELETIDGPNGEKIERYKGYMNRTGDTAEGMTHEYDINYHKNIRPRYIASAPTAEGAAKLGQQMDQEWLAKRDPLIKREALERNNTLVKSQASNLELQMSNAFTIDNPDALKVAIKNAAETQDKINDLKGLDPDTAQQNTSKTISKLIGKASLGALETDVTGIKSKAILESAKDQLSKEDFADLSRDVDDISKKRMAEVEKTIKENNVKFKNQLDTKLFDESLKVDDVRDALAQGFITGDEALGYKKVITSVKKLSPEIEPTVYTDLREEIQEIDIAPKLTLDQIGNFRKKVIQAWSDGKIDKAQGQDFIKDTDVKFSELVNKEAVNQALQANQKSKSFFQTVKNWSENNADKVSEVKARLYRQYDIRVKAGEDPAIVAQDIIKQENIRQNPNLGLLPDIPNAVLKADGDVHGGMPGKRKVENDGGVSTRPYVVKKDPVSGIRARIFEDGSYEVIK